MFGLIALLSLLLLVPAGHAAYAILHGGNDRLPATLAYSFLLGAGLFALLTALLSWLGVPSALSVAIGATILCSVFDVVRLLQRARKEDPIAFRRPDRLEAILLLLFVTGLILVARAAFATSLGADGQLFWGVRARAIVLEDALPSMPYMTARYMDHLDYPWLVPTLEAWIYRWLGTFDEQALNALFVLFFCVLLLLFYGAARRQRGPLLSAGFALLLATTPELSTVAALSGYADLPLAVFLFAGFCALEQWLATDDGRLLPLAATFFGLSVWVKREGLVYAAFALLIVTAKLLLGHRRRRAETLSLARRFVLPLVLVTLPWFSYLATHDVGNSDFPPLSLTLLFANLARLPIIAGHVMQEWFLRIGLWGVVWPLAILVLIWRRQLLRRSENAAAAIFSLVPPLGLSLAFIFSDYPSLTAHLNVSLSRIWLHTLPVAWFFILLQVPELEVWFRQRAARPRASEQ